jgi:hypothetical protein
MPTSKNNQFNQPLFQTQQARRTINNNTGSNPTNIVGSTHSNGGGPEDHHQLSNHPNQNSILHHPHLDHLYNDTTWNDAMSGDWIHDVFNDESTTASSPSISGLLAQQQNLPRASSSLVSRLNYPGQPKRSVGPHVGMVVPVNQSNATGLNLNTLVFNATSRNPSMGIPRPSMLVPTAAPSAAANSGKGHPFPHHMRIPVPSGSLNNLPLGSAVAPPAAGQLGGPPEKKKVSDALTYGPRFCEVFHTFCRKQNITIDITRHLMSLCLDYLVSFINWARESEEQVAWISNMLYDYDYLRPEVRNGIVMVLIYTFASIKATSMENMDMFTTLQDPDYGLGIANKFSLKIYNDPFCYLSFLKFSISSLIDAGAIPDNERQNQPVKKGKSSTINEDEVNAFHKMKDKLLNYLDSDNIAEAKGFVQIISTHWQLRGKVSLGVSRYYHYVLTVI